MELKVQVVSFLVGLTIFIGFLGFVLWLDKDDVTWKIDYPEVVDSTEIRAYVTLITCPPKVRCMGSGNLLTLSNGHKYRFYPEYNPKTQLDFFEVIERGDSIAKLKGVDSLYVVKTREKLLYKFHLRVTKGN
jgi:hypothetical protein